MSPFSCNISVNNCYGADGAVGVGSRVIKCVVGVKVRMGVGVIVGVSVSTITVRSKILVKCSVTFYVKKGVKVFVFVLVLLGGRGVFVAIGGGVFVAVGREVDVKVIVKVAVSVGVSAKKAIAASNSVLVGEGVAVKSLVPLGNPAKLTKVGVFLAFPSLA